MCLELGGTATARQLYEGAAEVGDTWTCDLQCTVETLRSHAPGPIRGLTCAISTAAPGANEVPDCHPTLQVGT